MKTKSLIIIGSLVALGLMIAFTATFFTIQSYSTTMRESVLEIHFEDESITIFITDQTQFGRASQELTTIPLHSLVEAHDRLPKTSKDDRIIAEQLEPRLQRQELGTRMAGVSFDSEIKLN